MKYLKININDFQVPILLHGSKACGLEKSDIQPLDSAVDRSVMKLFIAANISVVQECIAFFNFKLY